MERRKFTREFKLEAVRLQGPQTNNSTGGRNKRSPARGPDGTSSLDDALRSTWPVQDQAPKQ